MTLSGGSTRDLLPATLDQGPPFENSAITVKAERATLLLVDEGKFERLHASTYLSEN